MIPIETKEVSIQFFNSSILIECLIKKILSLSDVTYIIELVTIEDYKTMVEFLNVFIGMQIELIDKDTIKIVLKKGTLTPYISINKCNSIW